MRDDAAPTPLLPEVPRPLAVVDALVRSVADGLYVVDAEGQLTLINPAGEQLLGYRQDELLGRDMHAAVHFRAGAGSSQAKATCPLLGVLTSGGTAQAQSDWFTRADGTAFEVAYSSAAILDDGLVTGAVVLFRDVTDRSAVERRAARLTQERTEAGQEWQRNLMPTQLATVPSVDVAVSFRAVGDDALVGGDFYDVVPSGDGHLLVLGDVCGKGPGAAAVAAMVRFLLRGAADRGADPRTLLTLVNEELLQHPSRRFCTLVLAFVQQRADGRLHASVSCAGHPQPVLLRADGRTLSVGGAGALLGVFEELPVASQDIVLEAGDRLVLSSDGLTDAGRRRDLPTVPEMLEGHTEPTSAATVSLLEQAAGIIELEELFDDVAILVARLEPAVAIPPAPPAPVDAAPADPARIGEIETVFRSENERLAAGRPAEEETIAVTCECGRENCHELVAVPHDVYDRVRADDRCFVLLAGHEIPRAETVIERHGPLCVVRKHGTAGAIAEAAAE
jgi:PAS domain S-box-containing protein